MISNPKSSRLQLIRATSILAGIVCIGTSGFYFIEGWSFFESFYMSIITLSTVGFQEVHTLSDAGRIFVILYIVCGMGVALYGLAQLGEIILQTRLSNWLEKRRMSSELKKVSHHFIVCGYGRMGQSICQYFKSRDIPVVVIERNEALIEKIQNQGINFVIGDATEDVWLEEAGIARAKGLASVFDSDVDNLYVVLSAKLLNPKLQIISRAGSESSVQKLYKAGANRVVSPYTAGASKIAQLLINRNVAEIFESVSEGRENLEMVEIIIQPASPYAGKRLDETDFTKRGVIIVGIRKQAGELKLPPERNSLILPGDSLIAFGKRNSLSPILA